MMNYSRKIGKMGMIVFFSLFLLTNTVRAQDTAGMGVFGEDRFSLYGYTRNHISMTEDDTGNVMYLRLKGDWDPGANLSFHMELFADYRTGNQHPDYLPELLGISEDGVAAVSADALTLKIDHLWGMANMGDWDLQFGKIPVGWGTGYAFNPTAKTHTVSFLDDVSEETPGTLGILSGYTINDSTAVQGYLAFEDKTHRSSPEAGKWENIPYGVKVQKIVGAFDLSVSWIKEVVYKGTAYYKEFYLGGDFAGAVGDFGIYGEAALNLPRNEADTAFDFSGQELSELLEACVGFDYIFSSGDLTVRMEYYHQGRGEPDKAGYDLVKALSEGQGLQAEDYLVVHLEKMFLNYYNFAAGSLINLNDGSFVLMPELTYDAANNLQLSIGSLLPCGAEGSEFNGTWEVQGSRVVLLRPSVYLNAKISF